MSLVLEFVPAFLVHHVRLPHHRIRTHVCFSATGENPSNTPTGISVLRFMSSRGFHEIHTQKLVSLNPRCLSLDVDTCLRPKFQSLQQFGFSDSDLVHLIISNPNLLNPSFHLSKIELWIDLLGSVELLMKYVRSNQWILSYSIDKTVLPNLALLRGCGISEERISMAVRKHPRLLLHKPNALEQLIEQVEGMGVPRQSGMFLWALWTIRRVSKVRLKAKMELLISFGWSEEEFAAAFRKAPGFLSVSEGKLREKMDFLVNEAGCEPSYVALHPLLLSYSLEKRLIPRYRAVEMLKSRHLSNGKYQLFSLMTISQKKFMDKFVLRYKEEIPGLLDEYIA